MQLYDATFGRQKADSFSLHVNGQASHVRGHDAVLTFDDTRRYFRSDILRFGARVPNAGVSLAVLREGTTSMRVALGPSGSLSPATTLAKARQAVTG